MEANQETGHKIKACWTPEFHKLFVSLCQDQVFSGNKPGTCLNKKGWKYVTDEFYKRTGIMYDKKQFKNHWNTTKEQWKVWKKLKDSTNDDVWDKSTQVVKPNDVWWNNYLQVHPEASQFRYRGLPLADSLDTLFSDSPSGLTAASPPLLNAVLNCDKVPLLPMDSLRNDDTENACDAIMETLIEDKESPTLSQAELDSSVQRKRKNQEPERGMVHGAKRESTSLRGGRRIAHLCEAVESGNTVTSTLKERYSIKDCVDVLNEMPDIPQGSELYMFALDLFLKKEYRELFIVLGTAHLRLIWLKRQQRQFAVD